MKATRLLVSLVLVSSFLLVPCVSTRAKTPRQNATAPDTAVDSFIIEQHNGEASCREATPEEVPTTLRRRDDIGIPAQLLVPNSKSTSEQQGSGGLTINFVVLSQLQARSDKAAIIAAFQRAAAVWTARIKSPVTITMEIDYGPNRPNGAPFDANTLGSTASNRALVDYPGARTNLLASASSATETAIYNLLPATSAVPTDVGNGFVVSANRSVSLALGIPVFNPSDPIVATISFNSNFTFDLNPDDGVVGTDFNSVAVHEIGHALGFTSRSGQGETAEVTLWDLFRFRPGTTSATFPTAPRIMTKGGNQVYFTTQTFSVAGIPTSELGLSTGGGRPNDGGDGRQSSHWKDDSNNPSNYIGIMDPTLAAGVHKEATENDFSTLETIGWNLITSAGPPNAPAIPPPPTNDKFAGAQVLAGCSGTAAGSNIGATREANEPVHSPDEVQSDRSVWYIWQAPGSGSVTITTAGSNFDTVLSVYSGTSVGSLTSLGSSDDLAEDDKTSSVTFNALAGSIYRFAVDGYNNGNSGGDFGPLKINWTATGCSPNPIDSTAFFVRQHYLDFLNREPDAAGLAFWTNEINSCGADTQCIEIKRINVSAAFFLSIEFQQTGFFVQRMYRVAYGQATGNSTFPNAHTLPVPIVRLDEFLSDKQQIGDGVVVGETGWEQLLETRKQQYANDFVSRSRFTTAYPASLTAAQFVDALNTHAGNALSTAERNQLVNDLQSSAKTRAQVVRAVAEDADLVAIEKNRGFVLAQFFGYLRRNPNSSPDSDHTGFDFWLTKLNDFNGNFINAEMVKAFLVSGEYRGRFND